MQANGIVRPSKSLWARPIVVVPEKYGCMRFCMDFRKQNVITKEHVYPLPHVEDIFDNLCDAQYFTSLDLASGYWQVELDEDACTKSAFTTHHELFEITLNTLWSAQRACHIPVRHASCTVWLRVE